MAQFVAHHHTAEVSGSSMLPIIQSIGEIAAPVLHAHHLDHVQPDEWYPQQEFLDVFYDLSQGSYQATFNLVAVGMRIGDQAQFPPEVDSIEAILHTLDASYHRNNRDQVGGWDVYATAPNEMICISSTPYPADLEYGMVYSLVRRFRPVGVNFTVYHEPDIEGEPNRKNGGDRCMYRVVWDALT